MTPVQLILTLFPEEDPPVTRIEAFSPQPNVGNVKRNERTGVEWGDFTDQVAAMLLEEFPENE